MHSSGGYEDGYSASKCLWGTAAGSLVTSYLSSNHVSGLRALDLGCGEGKNANALAMAGCTVDAVDCSEKAIANGKEAFGQNSISWRVGDARDYLLNCDPYDIIVMYGLLHCLPSHERISDLIDLALRKTKIDGFHLIVAFNDGPHDLSAHPNFRPTLAPHDFYMSKYQNQELIAATDSIINETHPHNQIPHFHSITRLMARVIHVLP